MNRQSVPIESQLPRQPTVVVASTFTADPIGEVIAFWSRELGQAIELRLAPYNQVFQQLLDPASEAAVNTGGMNVFAIRVEDWGLTPDRPVEEAEQEAAGKAREFAAAIEVAAARFSARTLVCLCPASRSPASDAGRGCSAPDRGDTGFDAPRHCRRPRADAG